MSTRDRETSPRYLLWGIEAVLVSIGRRTIGGAIYLTGRALAARLKGDSIRSFP